MRETADLWAYEREAREQGYTAVCGVDEAGADGAGICSGGDPAGGL